MAIQLDTSYSLVGPDGTTVVMGNSLAAQSDTNFVGFLSAITGLDSPEVRTSIDPLAEGDGAAYGKFYYADRQVTLEGFLAPDPSASLNSRMDNLFRATNAMRSNATLTWTETGSVARQLTLRRIQPVRITDPRPKRFLIAMGSADPRIYSSTLHQQGTGTATNAGNVGTPPTVVMTSPTNTITITNTPSGGSAQTLTLTGLSGAGTVTVDFNAKTVTATSGASNRYSAVVFPTSVWWELQPGSNTVAVTGATVSATGVRFRDAWI